MRIAASILLLTVSLAADAPSFTVGALRRDGVVIPFAAYDGKRWVSRWPPCRSRAWPTWRSSGR